jgi:hypothetical protein
MTTTLAVLSHVNCKTNNNVLRIPDMSCLRFPWYLEMWFDPLFTFPLTMALTSIAAIGTAFSYHKRDENKNLFRTFSIATAVGAGMTIWTFKHYIATVKLYR